MSTLAHPIHIPPHHSLGNGPIDTTSLVANHRYGYTRKFEDSAVSTFNISSIVLNINYYYYFIDLCWMVRTS